MSSSRGQCLSCPEQLCIVDDDPNGEGNATCAKCRAEEDHDFDKEPGAVFSRSGERIDNIRTKVSIINQALADTLKTVRPQRPRQDDLNAQLRDLQAVAQHLGMAEAANALSTLIGGDQFACGKCKKLHPSFNQAGNCCLAEHVECPLSQLPADGEIGNIAQAREFSFGRGTFSKGWEVVRNVCDPKAAVPVYPLPPLLNTIMDRLANDRYEAGQQAIKDAVNRVTGAR